MIGGRIARHTLTVVRAPLVSDGSREYRDWDEASRHTISGWALDAGDTAADTENRDGASTEYTVRGPFAADVQGTDRIEWSGETYEIEGGTPRQPGLTARTSHTILRLVRWDG